MLSIQECKKRLPSKKFSDEQIEEIREKLYQLANIFIDEYLSIRAKGNLKNDC